MDEVPEPATSLNAAYAERRQQGQARKISNFFAGTVQFRAMFACLPQCHRAFPSESRMH
jgi:hypothetical protein